MNSIDTAELIAARKASPDWQGVTVLASLAAFGHLTLNAERDAERIKGMTPDRQAKAVDLFNRFAQLNKEIGALHAEIADELQSEVTA